MRYPPNFTQTMPLEAYDLLPEFAEYKGDDPELLQLRGIYFKTRDAEKLVFVGERENIYVTNGPNGEQSRPWIGVALTEHDAHGNVVVPDNYRPLPPKQRNPMDRGELTSFGLTDAKLGELAFEHLGEKYTPDRPGPSQLRRDVYDRVMDVIGPSERD